MGTVTNLLINQKKAFIGKNVEGVIYELFKWLRVSNSPPNMQTNMIYRGRNVVWRVEMIWSFSLEGKSVI